MGTFVRKEMQRSSGKKNTPHEKLPWIGVAGGEWWSLRGPSALRVPCYPVMLNHYEVKTTEA